MIRRVEARGVLGSMAFRDPPFLLRMFYKIEWALIWLPCYWHSPRKWYSVVKYTLPPHDGEWRYKHCPAWRAMIDKFHSECMESIEADRMERGG